MIPESLLPAISSHHRAGSRRSLAGNRFWLVRRPVMVMSRLGLSLWSRSVDTMAIVSNLVLGAGLILITAGMALGSIITARLVE